MGKTAMTPERMSVRRWLKEEGLALGDVAILAGLTAPTVSNLLSGTSKDKKSRQRLVTTLGWSPWPGIRPVGRYVFQKGCSIEVPEDAVNLARDFARENPGAIRRDGVTLTFLRTTPVFFSDPSLLRVVELAKSKPGKQQTTENDEPTNS